MISVIFPRLDDLAPFVRVASILWMLKSLYNSSAKGLEEFESMTNTPFEYPEIIDERYIAIWNNQLRTGIIPHINRHIYE